MRRRRRNFRIAGRRTQHALSGRKRSMVDENQARYFVRVLPCIDARNQRAMYNVVGAVKSFF